MSLKNHVQLIGNLGADPEIKKAGESSKVINISLATNEKYKDNSGELKDDTQWHNLVFWNAKAEILEKFCKKGSEIGVTGKLVNRSWEKDGQKYYTTEVHVNELLLLGGKPAEDK
tara:strand:- start:157 stop:501 length:345 start_codon:yes stop_codon:yes gene_type:complete